MPTHDFGLILEDICRLCLAQGCRMIQIFEDNHDIKKCDIPDVLGKCFDLTIKNNDGLPRKICESCYSTVLMYYKFWKQCKQNDAILRKKLSAFPSADSTSSKFSGEIGYFSRSCQKPIHNKLIAELFNASDNNQSEGEPSLMGNEVEPLAASSEVLKEREPESKNNASLVEQRLVKVIESDWVDEEVTVYEEQGSIFDDYPWRVSEETTDTVTQKSESLNSSLIGDEGSSNPSQSGCLTSSVKRMEVMMEDTDSFKHFKVEPRIGLLLDSSRSHSPVIGMARDHECSEVVEGEREARKVSATKHIWNPKSVGNRGYFGTEKTGQMKSSGKDTNRPLHLIKETMYSPEVDHIIAQKSKESEPPLATLCNESSASSVSRHISPVEKRVDIETVVIQNSDCDMLAGKISHDENGFWICSICNKKARRFSSLKNHVKSHFPPVGRQCYKCNISFHSERALERHLRKHDLLSSSLGHTCMHCSKTFQLKHLLERHISLEHAMREGISMTSSKRFRMPCGLCLRVFHSHVEMEEHYESCNEDCSDSESDISDICEDNDCGLVTNNSSLATENQVMKPKRHFPCHICHLRFSFSKSLAVHMKEEHNCDSPFRCDTVGCGLLFKTPLSLRNHRKNHRRDFKCDLCTVTYRDKSDLDEHMNVHKNERPFKCELCGKAFFRKNNLREHVLIHAQIKSFTCQDCGMQFQKAHNLKTHRSLHIPVPNFICDECGNSYKSKRALNHHMISHNSFVYACSHCNYKSKYKAYFEKHSQVHFASM